MTDQLKQSISALLDEEVSEIEVHRLLREFDSDGELKGSWVRYQQIRSVSQGQHVLSESQHLALHSRISSAIELEDSHTWEGKSVSRWQKPAASFAVAASLVVAVLVGVNFNQQGSTNGSLGAEIASNPGQTNVIDAQVVSTSASAPFTSAPSTSGPVNSFAAPLDLADLPEANMTESDASEIAVAFNESDLELKELDEEKQQRLREYLMRHDRMSQMNTQTRTVNFQTPKRSDQN